MSRDILKTVIAVVVVAVVILATFLYGNAQRVAKEKKTQQLQTEQTVAKSSPAPTATTKIISGNNSGTSAVKSPEANSLQGGKTPSPKPAASPSGAGVVAGGSTTNMPQTGPEAFGFLGAGVTVLAAASLRRSRRSLHRALRSTNRS